jgi:hypothetical protein
LGIGKHGVDVKNDTAKRMLPMPQNLPDVILGVRLQHFLAFSIRGFYPLTAAVVQKDATP